MSISNAGTTPSSNFSVSCGSTKITLGMSADEVKQACGEATKSYKQNRAGAQYVKLKYKDTTNSDDDDNELELKFSDMQEQGKLKLYEIELNQEIEEHNPYKQ
ncbi:DUF2845 domain-containing protein [Francisellaceae bacterium]|nr:DUF2845 domain-containing protein [Francisellaceae bacterium]